jgi:DtxR family transcriptional regulator, Mn-dependent transcriptional regulator
MSYVPSSPVIEDYLKAIYSLESHAADNASINAVSERLGVSAGAVSAMVRKLSDDGLVEHTPYRGVALTERGQQIALETIRHHRLLELFLSEILGMSWDRVHDEAEVLEHVLSDDLERLIAEKLGHPARDPHGDPIPTGDFYIDEAPTERLEDLTPGARGRFVRVSDSDPAMLRYLADLGIAPGSDFQVLERQPFGGPLRVRFGTTEHMLGGQLTASMRVEVA